MSNPASMTDAEWAIVTKVMDAGHTEVQIERTPAAFRVRYRCAGGTAYGSQAIIYNLKKSVKDGVANIKRLKKEIDEHRTT